MPEQSNDNNHCHDCHHTPAKSAPVGYQGDYTCPMHPEIVQGEPGSCPICGMALEPMTVSLDDANDEE